MIRTLEDLRQDKWGDSITDAAIERARAVKQFELDGQHETTFMKRMDGGLTIVLCGALETSVEVGIAPNGVITMASVESGVGYDFDVLVHLWYKEDGEITEARIQELVEQYLTPSLDDEQDHEVNS